MAELSGIPQIPVAYQWKSIRYRDRGFDYRDVQTYKGQTCRHLDIARLALLPHKDLRCVYGARKGLWTQSGPLYTITARTDPRRNVPLPRHSAGRSAPQDHARGLRQAQDEPRA